MRIQISLSTESIQNAIRLLNERRQMLEEDLEQFVEILANEGAEVANAAYGDFPVAATHHADGNHAEITVSGDMPLIAEFGAGQATMPVLFENNIPEVYEGSYSESPEGSGEYARFGSWHFGGEYYTEVPAKHGLLDAKQYIIENSTEIAREVMSHD